MSKPKIPAGPAADTLVPIVDPPMPKAARPSSPDQFADGIAALQNAAVLLEACETVAELWGATQPAHAMRKQLRAQAAGALSRGLKDIGL